MVSRFSGSLLLVAFATNLAWAQAIKSDYPGALELRSKFPKTDIVAVNALTVYTFEVDKEKGLQARERTEARYIAVQSNATITLDNYVNNYVKLDNVSMKDGMGRKLRPLTYCSQQVDEDIFYTDGSYCLYRTSLQHAGDLVDFTIENVISDAKYLVIAPLVEHYPSKRRELRFLIPKSVSVELVDVNFSGYTVQKSSGENSNGSVITYSLSMVDSPSGIENRPGPLTYLPHILIITKGYTDNKGTYHSLLGSTEDLYKWYSSLTGQINNDYSPLKPRVEELTKGLKTDEEKAAAIFYWVQDNIKYIAFEDGVAAFKPEDAKNVYFNKYGDCKGMANLTKAMLTLAGLDARLTWIGTDRIPYTYKTPSIAVNNHMICTVVLNGKHYYLDATEKFCQLGSYAERIQGKEVMIEDGSGFTIEKVPVEPLEVPMETATLRLRVNDQKLEGMGNLTLQGERKRQALQTLRILSGLNQERLLKSLVVGEANPEKFALSGVPPVKRDSATQINYAIGVTNHIYRNNNDVYVNLELDKSLSKTRIPKDRKIPYQFYSRTFKVASTEFEVPDGFKVQQVPPPLKINDPLFDFELEYRVNEKTVTYNKRIRVHSKFLPVASFDSWNKAIAEISKYYDQPITLQTK